MTFLIRGSVESEIGALSFYRQPGLHVHGWQGGQEGQAGAQSGRLGLQWHQLALFSQDGHSQWPALTDVGYFEIFAYDRKQGRARECE